MREHHTIIEPSPNPLPIEQAAAALRKALAGGFGTNDPAAPATLTQAVEPINPLTWLSGQEASPRILWMNRDRDFTMAGIGIADQISFEERGSNEESFRRLTEELDARGNGNRYFGGFHFDNSPAQDALWQGFPSCSFILPLVQLTLEQGRHALQCNLPAGSDRVRAALAAALAETLENLRPANEALPALPGMLDLDYSPGRESWMDNCSRALESFESGEMEKIMLARRATIRFDGAVDPMAFLLRYPYPQNATYRFYFEPEPGRAFFSFTPERLYRREGSRIMTEALAGTCAKELVGGGDLGASEALLASEKDIREHRFVMEMIRRQLEPVCSRVDMEEKVRVLQLNRLAHLYTRCSADLLAEHASDSTLLSRLHPTPAVGGVPKERAMRRITELEPFSRGWYAAPVGWISREASEFAVGIRSALVEGERAHLFSGAGLVKGSDPASEWTEVEQKIGDLLAITRQEA